MSNVDKNAEILLVNPTASGGTINLPLTTTLPYRTLTIKHIGSTSLNGITLSAQGGDTFEDGTTSYIITQLTTFVTFYANASANKWVVVGGTNSFAQTISSLTVNTINGQTYIPISPINLVSTTLLASSLVSTVSGLGNLGYLSTVSLSNLVSTSLLESSLQSTVRGLGNLGYLSTVSLSNLVSTSLLESSLQSTVRGLGTIGYISSATSVSLSNLVSIGLLDSTLQSTVFGLVDHLELRSTVVGLGTFGYISSLPRFLSTNAMFTSSLVASTISTTNILFTNALVSRSTNLSSVYISDLQAVKGYISSLSIDELLLGTGDGWTDTGPLRATYISSLQENTGSLYANTIFLGGTSTLNQIRYWGLFGNYNNTILAEVSTGTAVGAQEFLVFKGSSASDRIRFQTTGDIRFEPQVAAREFSTATALATPTLIMQSNLVGIATATPVATLDVRGSVFGTTISTQQLFTSSFVATTISTSILFTSSFVGTSLSTNIFFTNALVARSTNLSSVYISSLTGVTGYISSLTTDSLTIGDGNGWVDFGAARAVIFSSIQENTGSLYVTTAFIGNTSTLNQIRFWGLFGNYNNTILAEVSTGTAVGAQEFLVFKGSSASDRIRFQTTGDIRFEPQVAAREFSTATALATPTMILQSNLVGIATASPVASLDVRGTAFATTLSTQQLSFSSFNGIAFSNLISTSVFESSLQSTVFGLVDHIELRSTVIGLGTIGYLSSGQGLVSTAFFDTALQSTVGNLGQIYLSTATGGGGITAGNLASTVEGLGTVNYISGPIIQATSVFATDTLLGINTIASTMFMYDPFIDQIENFPPWVNSNQISGSDPEPAPLRLDVFGSARILKNLYVGSTTTVLTTAGVQATQLSSFHTTASTITLSDKRPLFASTNTVTSITDVFLNDYYLGQRIPAYPLVISTLTTNMTLQPEFLGMHFLLVNSDSNFTQLLVRADATFVSNVPDGWYCYLKQFPDSNFFNDGVGAETDLGNVPLPNTNSPFGPSNFMAPMKFIVSGGFKIPY